MTTAISRPGSCKRSASSRSTRIAKNTNKFQEISAVTFSMHLSDDVIEVRDWVHKFATEIIRPAATEWVLNGTKTWATNGGIANVHIVVASVYPELGTRGQASFVIPPDAPGLSQGQKFKKHGIRASHTAEVVLDNVRLSEDMILGGR